MARLRGTQQLFNEQATDNDGISSEIITVGSATNVVLMIRNDGANAVTVKIQIGSGNPAPGRNTMPDPDGDDWYPLLKRDGSGAISFDVAANENFAVDLSPFGGAYARLVATSKVADSHGEVTAWASVTG